MSDGGIGDDFFDDHKLSASPALGTSPNSFGGGRGRGGKKKRQPRGKNNNNSNATKVGGHSPPQHYNNQHHSRSRENSPKRQHYGGGPGSRGGSRSRENSPNRRHQNRGNQYHNQNRNDLHHHYNPKKDGPPDITVVVNRVDLYDSAAHIHAVAVDGPSQPAPPYPVAPYDFEPDRSVTKISDRPFSNALVAIQRVPYAVKYVPCEDLQAEQKTVPLPPPPPGVAPVESSPPPPGLDRLGAAVAALDLANANGNATDNNGNNDAAKPGQAIESVVDNDTPNPYDKSIDKYWAQRRRLFTKFDLGIQLDSEGWYSVTPEIIADHVAHRVGTLSLKAQQIQKNSGSGNGNANATTGWVVLDAFCGCGGNGIAFSKLPAEQVSLVVCVDTDRKKLRMAAHNASLYQIPTTQIVFVECNSIFILKHCYRNGMFILDQPELMMEAGAAPMQLPNPVPTEVYKGYHIGGINMLPRRIDCVFMDPPWGGVDYEVLGKNGYDLEKNMKIKCQVCLQPNEQDNTIQDDFFDSFCGPPAATQHHKSNRSRKKSEFNNVLEDYVNGSDMLQLAAAATATKMVLYDLPRNTNKTSLGQSALAAGYRGNLKLEEHFLNGRLKTVTAYFGTGFEHLLNTQNQAAEEQALLHEQSA